MRKTAPCNPHYWLAINISPMGVIREKKCLHCKLVITNSPKAAKE